MTDDTDLVLGTAVICTALDVEYQAVREHLDGQLVEREERGTLYQIGTFPTARGHWIVALVQTGPGNTQAGIELERAISVFHPQCVLFVGVAGGRKDVALGDVVIADYVYDYESGKDTATDYLPRIKTAAPSHRLLQRAKQLARDAAWQHRIRPIPPETAPKAVVKPIAAGGKVIADLSSTTAQLLNRYCGDAAAVEMEGHGFLHGAYINDAVEALVVRGISDLLSGKTEAADEHWQPVASRHAAALAFELLARSTMPPTIPDAGVPQQLPRASSARYADAIRPIPTGDEVARPELLEPLISKLLVRNRKRDRGRANVQLVGPGGFGKTTLAMLALENRRIKKRFKGRIYWVTLNEHTRGAARLAVVNGLLSSVSGKPVAYDNLNAATERLGTLLRSRPTLLVIDDVWYQDQLEPFLVGDCTRLITTRIDDLWLDDHSRVDVGVMTANQAQALLGRGVGGASIADWSSLVHHAGGWPILLDLVARALHKRVGRGEPLHAAIRNIETRLDAEGPTVFDPKNPERRRDAVAATVSVSIDVLSETDSLWPDRWAELAVFPRGTRVPLATLARYWGNKMSGDEVDRLCEELADLSLVQQLDLNNTPSLQLHDVIHDLLAHRERDRLPSLHRRLVDAHAVNYWWQLPTDEPYLWNWLTYHLSQLADAGADDLLCDLRWIEARLRHDGPRAIDTDFAYAVNDCTFRLGRALIQSAHLFAPLDPPTSLAATIANRLRQISGLEDVIERYEQSWLGHWLAPVWPLPDEPHPAFCGTLAHGVSSVQSFAVPHDGTRLATGHHDGHLSMWDLETGRPLATAHPHERPVNAIDVTREGLVVSVSNFGNAYLWNPDRPTELTRFRGYKAFQNGGVAADPFRPRVILYNGQFLGTQLYSHSGRRRRFESWWRTAVKVPLRRRPISREPPLLAGVAFAASAGFIVGLPWPANIAASIFAFLAALGITGISSRMENLGTYNRFVSGVAFSPDGALVATNGSVSDGTVRVWDARKFKQQAVFVGPEGAVGAVAVDSSDTWLGAVRSGLLFVWNIQTGDLHAVHRISELTGGSASVRFSPDGALIAACCDNNIIVCAVKDGTLHASLTNQPAFVPGEGFTVPGVGFTKDSQFLLTTGVGPSIRKWQLDQLSGRLEDSAIRVVAFSSDGTTVITGGPRNEIGVRTIDGSRHTRLDGHIDNVYAVAIAPDGTWLASASDEVVRTWNIDGTLRSELVGHTRTVFSIVIASDGSWLASGASDNTIRIWNTDGTACARLIGPPQGPDQMFSGISNIALGGHGQWLAALGMGTVYVWHTKTWNRTEYRRSNVHTMTLSAKQDLIATSRDGMITIDSLPGKTQYTLRGPNEVSPTGMAFSPDGTMLATVGFDQVVRVWRIDREECIAALRVDDVLYDCAWSPTNPFIAVGGNRGCYLLELRRAA